MHTRKIAAMVLWSASAAQAQDSSLTLSVGVKAWAAEWSTFTYVPAANAAQVIAQVDPVSRVLLVPSVSVRWDDFLASASGFTQGYGNDERREWDVNAGWSVMPGVTLTVGYKSIAQLGDYSYKPKGWIAGVNAAAPLSGPWSLYGSLGMGRVKTRQGGNAENRIVSFAPSPYRITEVGLAYGLPMDGLFAFKSLNLAAGYRSQVLVSKGVLEGGGSANDLTQGFSVSVSAVF